MKSFRPATSFSIFCCVVACWAFIVSNACAETIRFSCSNQIYAAFEKDKIAAFKAATGINVDVINVSSDAAAQRMMSDLSDLAATARGSSGPGMSTTGSHKSRSAAMASPSS